MRLNKNTYEAFADLETGVVSNIKAGYLFSGILGEQNIDSVRATAMDLYKQSSNQYVLTAPFRNAVQKASPKIMDTMKHLQNDRCDCGVIFEPNGFYLYLLNPTDGFVKMVVVGFDRVGIVSFGILSNDLKFVGVFPDENGRHSQSNLERVCTDILVTLFFIHHCEIEQKVVSPLQKLRSMGVKYYNESKLPFTVLDCTWFTDLVRTTPFTVNGFYRWQPCGVGNSLRKLKWVDSFEKKGYTRKNRKESILE